MTTTPATCETFRETPWHPTPSIRSRTTRRTFWDTLYIAYSSTSCQHAKQAYTDPSYTAAYIDLVDDYTVHPRGRGHRPSPTEQAQSMLSRLSFDSESDSSLTSARGCCPLFSLVSASATRPCASCSFCFAIAPRSTFTLPAILTGRPSGVFSGAYSTRIRSIAVQMRLSHSSQSSRA